MPSKRFPLSRVEHKLSDSMFCSVSLSSPASPEKESEGKKLQRRQNSGDESRKKINIFPLRFPFILNSSVHKRNMEGT
jgi:hypothetical protein